MKRELLTSKIHRARITETELDYEGSLTIDADLLDAADILPHEKVQVLNITNGKRLVTYAIEGDRNSGVVCLNGAAARLGEVGDRIIVLTFGYPEKPEDHEPTIIHLDDANRIQQVE